jgi:hypothetical protein
MFQVSAPLPILILLVSVSTPISATARIGFADAHSVEVPRLSWIWIAMLNLYVLPDIYPETPPPSITDVPPYTDVGVPPLIAAVPVGNTTPPPLMLPTTMIGGSIHIKS